MAEAPRKKTKGREHKTFARGYNIYIVASHENLPLIQNVPATISPQRTALCFRRRRIYDSLRYTYDGTRRMRQLALGCESN